MMLVKVAADYSITAFRSGSRPLLERLKTDNEVWADRLDTSLPLACYRFDPGSQQVVLRDNWEDIQRLEDNKLAVATRDIENRLAAQKLTIKEQAQALYNQPVSYQDGTVWRGGQASAASIQGAIALAKAQGLVEITLRDAARAAQSYPIAQAEQIALLIGLDYEAKFQAKEDALYALDQIDLNAADALEQIQAITL